MNNEDFFDILGDLDDDIISDAAFSTEKKKHGRLFRLITVSAAVFVFIIGTILIRNGFMNTDYNVPSENSASSEEPASLSEDISETASQDDPEIFTNAFIAPEDESDPPESPSENESIPSTEEPSSEEPTSSDSGTSPDDSIVFNEAKLGDLLSVGTDSAPDGYPIWEKTDIFTLEQIYGTSVLPSYIPSTGAVDSIINSVDKIYNVYYNEDKTEVYCNNMFTFTLRSGGILYIEASNRELEKLSIEKNGGDISYIKDVPVALYKAVSISQSTFYSAYLVKDGCYFRVQLAGFNSEETEFLKILSSLI